LILVEINADALGIGKDTGSVNGYIGDKITVLRVVTIYSVTRYAQVALEGLDQKRELVER